MKSRISLLTLALCLLVSGCADDLFGGPTIDQMSVTPSTISVNGTGMTDEFFTVTMEVSGFTEAIDAEETRIYFNAGSEEIDAVFGTHSEAGTTLTFGRIATTWFQDQPAGTYDLSAEVKSVPDESGRAAESVNQSNLATVTITP